MEKVMGACWGKAYHICLLDVLLLGPSSCPSPSLPLLHMIQVVAADPALLVITVLWNCSRFVGLLIFGGQLDLG